jgi:hypothetical protein
VKGVTILYLLTNQHARRKQLYSEPKPTPRAFPNSREFAQQTSMNRLQHRGSTTAGSLPRRRLLFARKVANAANVNPPSGFGM